MIITINSIINCVEQDKNKTVINVGVTHNSSNKSEKIEKIIKQLNEYKKYSKSEIIKIKNMMHLIKDKDGDIIIFDIKTINGNNVKIVDNSYLRTDENNTKEDNLENMKECVKN